MKVAVAGDPGFCLGFKLAGINAAYELDEDAFAAEIDDIVAEEEGVLIVAGDHMSTLSERKRLELQNMVDPVVIPVGTDAGDEDLRAKIKQAIGVDIWSDE